MALNGLYCADVPLSNYSLTDQFWLHSFLVNILVFLSADISVVFLLIYLLFALRFSESLLSLHLFDLFVSYAVIIVAFSVA